MTLTMNIFEFRQEVLKADDSKLRRLVSYFQASSSYREDKLSKYGNAEIKYFKARDIVQEEFQRRMAKKSKRAQKIYDKTIGVNNAN